MRSPVRTLIRFRFESWERFSHPSMLHATSWAQEPPSTFAITDGIADRPIRVALAEAERLVREHCEPFVPAQLWFIKDSQRHGSLMLDLTVLLIRATDEQQRLLRELAPVARSALLERLAARCRRLGLRPSQAALTRQLEENMSYRLTDVGIGLHERHGAFGRFSAEARANRHDCMTICDAVMLGRSMEEAISGGSPSDDAKKIQEDQVRRSRLQAEQTEARKLRSNILAGHAV